jgi:c-di-GMP-binding flagellar brake protein YcgR
VATTIARPETADQVALHLPCCDGQLHHSQLLAVKGDEWRVAAPMLHPDAPPESPFPAGAEIGISWVLGPGTWAEMSSRLLDEASPDYHNWRVEVFGEPAPLQRRHYARVAHISSVRMIVDGGSTNGTMVDLSEGGVSCAVASAPPGLSAGNPLQIELAVGTDMLTVAAVVVRTIARPAGDAIVAARFTGLDDKLSDRLRKEVFALQLQQRARS